LPKSTNGSRAKKPNGVGGRGKKGFNRITADQMGCSKESVRLKAIRAQKIVPEVKDKLRNPGDNKALAKVANTGVELDVRL
jgi:hypothetical protein